MSTAYEESGRIRQKQRTRNDLVAAARDLIASGGTAPTVEEAAAAASVSRTTAYRYFRSQRELLAAAHPEVELTSLLPADVGDDLEARIEAVIRGFMAIVVDTESQQRTMLRLSLEDARSPGQLPLRQGRAIGWFSEALDPLSGQARHRWCPPARHRDARGRWHRGVGVADGRCGSHARRRDRPDGVVGGRPGASRRGVVPQIAVTWWLGSAVQRMESPADLVGARIAAVADVREATRTPDSGR